MIVPRYWAEARLQHREPGRQVTVRRFGWSDISQQDAQRIAEERAADALARIRAGEALPRREHKVPYNGAEGLPIREEIVAVHGEAIITRNAYGALCLNTPDVLFADVDFVEPPWFWFRRLFPPLLLAALGAAVALGVGVLGYCAALALALLGTSLLSSLLRGLLATLNLGPERLAERRVHRFVERHPGWQLRVYRTPAGLRLLAMHRRFDPADAEVTELFRAVHADGEYVSMCRRQRCFRARVTPKPWRIGISDHLRPRPGVWPVDPERLPARRRWVADYELKAQGHAACRYVETLGGGRTDAGAEAVRKVHDELSRANTKLPLA